MIVVVENKILEVDELFDSISLRMKIFVSRFHVGGLNFCVVHSFMGKFHFKSFGFFSRMCNKKQRLFGIR